MLGKLFEKALLVCVLGYIIFNLWTFYEIFSPNECSNSQFCVYPSWLAEDEYTMHIIVNPNSTDDIITGKFTAISGLDENFNVTVPKNVFNNGSANCDILILNNKKQAVVKKNIFLTAYRQPKPKAFKLVITTDNETMSTSDTQKERPTTHWLSSIYIAVLNHPVSFNIKQIPSELHSILSIQSKGSRYLYSPVFHINPQLQSTSDWLELPIQQKRESDKLELKIKIESLSIGKLRMRCMLEHATDNLKSLGFKDKDIEDVRSLFTDTNIYLLGTTVIVSVFHMFFDFLAFKNDIQFWRSMKNTAGISIRVVIWRCFSTAIVFLYLFEERSSLLILVPSGISFVIEFWKLLRMSKVSFSFHRGLQIGTRNSEEKETDELDSHFMKRLMIIMTPLCLGGAVYSLLYMPHRSWFSWILETAVNGVYAFGFLLMTPQLFINYRLKSVASLPWRALTYKAFNTFIDDFFAFIIKMPTAHRIACFRDDVIFVIYLYQRWLYPVDYTRINEFGQCEETLESDGPGKKVTTGKENKKNKLKIN